MSRHHYRFASRWEVARPVDQVYAVLHGVADYPRWWPQVRRVEEIDERSGHVVCRSALPYALRLVLRAEQEDPKAGVLGVAVSGDLEGWCRWTLAPSTTGTRLAFDQEVTAVAPVLRLGGRLGVLGRPVLEANHAWMMRGCRRGLERRLAELSGLGGLSGPGGGSAR